MREPRSRSISAPTSPRSKSPNRSDNRQVSEALTSPNAVSNMLYNLKRGMYSAAMVEKSRPPFQSVGLETGRHTAAATERDSRMGKDRIRDHAYDGSPVLGKKQSPSRSKKNNKTVQLKEGEDRSNSKWKRGMMASDSHMLHAHLTQLTDPALSPIDVIDSLTCIKNIAEDSGEATKILIDCGAVPIILSVLKRLPHDIDVFLKASSLLEAMGREDELVATMVAKNKGLELILGNVKTLIAQAKFTGMNGGLPGGGKIPAVHFHEDFRTIRSSTERLEINPSGRSQALNRRIESTMALDSQLQEDSIVDALLGKYRDQKFMNRLDDMDKSSMQEAIRYFMNVFGKLDKILMVTQYLGLDVDVDQVVARIIEQAQVLINSEALFLTLVDPETTELVPIDIGSNFQIKDIVKSLLRYPTGVGIAGWVAKHGITMHVKNVLGNEYFDTEIDTRSGEVVAQSVLCVPATAPNGVVKGVLQAVNKLGGEGSKGPFTSEDEFIMRALGRRLGIIINNVQMYQDMEQTQKKVEVLLETTKSLSSTVHLEELVRMIMDAAKELLNADRCTLFLIDRANNQLVGHIQGVNSIQEIRLPINVGIAGHVATHGECVNIIDAYKDPRFNPEVDRKTGYVTKTILCTPIKNINGETIGVTQMINRKIGVFNEQDIRILGSFSAQAAVAIEKSYLFKKTEDMRKYLQSILSSITNCVITLSGTRKMTTMNRPWFAEALAVTEKTMQEEPIEHWIGTENHMFLNDIRTVYETSLPVYSASYELKGPNKSTYINYHVVPLMAGVDEREKGVVMVLEDISAEKRAINTLGRYMSPALVKQIMSEGGAQLGGVRKQVSVLFSDIRSFTTISESMQPHDVVRLLNSHFEDAVDAILAEQGILDKYIGDALMAVFGVPYESPEDSIHACNAALRMSEAVHIANAKRVAAGGMAIKIGIGINTGEALSGNIGSTKRMEFSCIGDTVNLASRLEGLTKYYGITILISEYTRREVDKHFVCREVDKVMVLGKSKGVMIHELIQRRSEPLDETKERQLQLYAEGLAMYKEKNFAEAEKKFSLAYEATNDGPSKTMASRCLHFMKHPPPEDWNGVYAATDK